MGDEVKITVIATGFREQLPERRARMLEIAATPVVSVPVVAPGSWMEDSRREDSASGAAQKKPLPFQSEAEEKSRDAEGYTQARQFAHEEAPHRIACAAPSVAPPVAVFSAAPVAVLDEYENETMRQDSGATYESGAMPDEDAAPGVPTPRFAELATEFGQDSGSHAEPDLDVPAVLRRGSFQN